MLVCHLIALLYFILCAPSICTRARTTQIPFFVDTVHISFCISINTNTCNFPCTVSPDDKNPRQPDCHRGYPVQYQIFLIVKGRTLSCPQCFYKSFFSPLLSFATAPDSTRSAARFGSTMTPLKRSERFQTSSTLRSEPTKIKITAIKANGFTPFCPNRYFTFCCA